MGLRLRSVDPTSSLGRVTTLQSVTKKDFVRVFDVFDFLGLRLRSVDPTSSLGRVTTAERAFVQQKTFEPVFDRCVSSRESRKATANNDDLVCWKNSGHLECWVMTRTNTMFQ